MTDPSSRRRFLQGCGATVVGVAGCLQSGERAGTQEPREATSTATAEETETRTATETEPTAVADPIPIGSILPITGALSAYGSGMQEAVELAVEDVNDAGGPLGRELELYTRDSETSPDRAVQKYRSLVDEQAVVGFVGAASSGVSMAIARNVADDEVMQVSNASTTPTLSEIGYAGGTKYFGRTSPNDGQMGIAMGKILDEYVAADSAAFLYVDSPYGQGLANEATEAFDGETHQMVGYDSRATDYTSTLDALFQDDPDAVGFVGYPMNGKKILQQWNDGGYGGEWVLSEGLNSTAFFSELQEIVAGMYVASPDPERTPGASRFGRKIGDANTLFAAHAYDAVVLQALAMHRAGEDSGSAIARNVRSVSRPGGTTVTVGELETAFAALDDGNDVNYEGAASPVDMSESLEPLIQYAALRIQDDASVEVQESIPRAFFEGKL